MFRVWVRRRRQFSAVTFWIPLGVSRSLWCILKPVPSPILPGVDANWPLKCWPDHRPCRPPSFHRPLRRGYGLPCGDHSRKIHQNSNRSSKQLWGDILQSAAFQTFWISYKNERGQAVFALLIPRKVREDRYNKLQKTYQKYKDIHSGATGTTQNEEVKSTNSTSRESITSSSGGLKTERE